MTPRAWSHSWPPGFLREQLLITDPAPSFLTALRAHWPGLYIHKPGELLLSPRIDPVHPHLTVSAVTFCLQDRLALESMNWEDSSLDVTPAVFKVLCHVCLFVFLGGSGFGKTLSLGVPGSHLLLSHLYCHIFCKNVRTSPWVVLPTFALIIIIA